jgi:hypothetical protein
MRVEEKQNLSVYYYIKETLSGYPTVTITDDYPNAELVLPSVSVVGNEIYPKPSELGNRRGIRNRIWDVEIFCSMKTQRDDITSLLLDTIEDEYIPVYDYDQGFPPSGLPMIGVLKVKPNSLIASPTIIFPELVEKLYWRGRIKFLTEYESIT